MPRVRKTSGGRVYVRSAGQRFDIGDTADVSESEAAYLCDERGDFEPIDEGGADDDVVAEPPLNPAEFSVDKLRDALEDADYDADELAAIADAEAAGEDRTTAHDAIDAAREG